MRDRAWLIAIVLMLIAFVILCGVTLRIWDGMVVTGS
jgi:hypothetical protein